MIRVEVIVAIVVTVLWLVALVVFLVALARAPFGWEDELGFHLGKPPE